MLQVKMSVVFKRVVLGIGVVPIIALAFMPVHAKTTKDSAKIILELQAIRREVAELRDMVERQQYELQKIKRSQQATAPSVSSSGSGYGAAIEPETARQTYSQTYPTVSSNRQAVSRGQKYASVPPSSVSHSTSREMVSDSDQRSNDGSFYRPENDQSQSIGGQQISDQQSNGENQNRAAISSATISAPPIENSVYPPVPVIERSIGGNTSTSIPASQIPVPRLPASRSIEQQQRLPKAYNMPMPNSPDTSPNIAPGTSQRPVIPSGGGVIAVPDAAAINGFPNRQSQMPESQRVSPVSSTEQPSVGSPQSQPVQGQPVPQQPAVAEQHAVSTSQAPSQGQLASGGLKETDYYQQGFDLLKQSRHEDAVSMFKKQIALYPKGERVDDAYYWIAESMYVNRKLDASKENFKVIIDNFKQSSRVPDAMLKTAYIEQDQGNKIEARILLQEIIQFHPRSNAAISAKNRLSEIK